MTKTIANICVLLFAVLMVATSQVSCFDIKDAKIVDIQRAIRQGQVTCRQVVEFFLDRIRQYGRNRGTFATGAIVNTNPAALEEADALDRLFARYGRLKGALHCAPLVAKDCIDVAGIPTTNGVNAFKSQIPLKDATVVANCKRQGAIFIAKANMSPLSDKEAWGHSETGGLIRNPFGLGYTTYGSSGGNSAAANAMLAIGGIAGETGVSINLPSSTGNLVGLRPPVELLKSCNCRDGVLPNSYFQDVVGPIARSAEDAILIFDGMIGKEGEYGSTVMDSHGLRNLKINIFQLMAYGSFPFMPGASYAVDPKIMQLFTVATRNMAKEGARVSNVSVDFQSGAPSIMAMFSTGYTSCIPGWRDAYFGDATRFGAGSFHSCDEVVAAKKLPAFYQTIWENIQNKSRVAGQCARETQAFQTAVAALKTNVINPILADADIAIWPTVPVFPAKLGQDAMNMDWGSSTTAPINLVLLAAWAGYPSMTVPLGFSDPLPDAPQGLPVGIFMMTSPDKLPQLLKAAYAYQEKYRRDITKFPTNFIGSDGLIASATGITPRAFYIFALLACYLLASF